MMNAKLKKLFSKKLKKPNPVFVLVGIVLMVYSISLIFALTWAFMTSFKTRTEYINNPIGLPTTFHFSNYAVAFQNFGVTVGKMPNQKVVGIGAQFLNSLLYAGGCALCLVFTTCTVAYCCAKFSKFKISAVYVGIVIVTMAIPSVGGQAGELKMLIDLGIYDTMIGMWIMKLNFQGVYFLVFLASFKGISQDYIDAAYIDGANNYKVYFRLILPLVSKTFATVFLIDFIGFWNDYQVPLLYMPSHPTVAYGLYNYRLKYRAVKPGQDISSLPMRMAGCMIVFVPIFLVFVAFQKRLLGNVSMGGLKE